MLTQNILMQSKIDEIAANATKPVGAAEDSAHLWSWPVLDGTTSSCSVESAF